MRILAADTSTAAGSIALAELPPLQGRSDVASMDAVRILVERSWSLAPAGAVPSPAAPNHSARFVDEVEEILRSAGLGAADLDGLACAVGPGSFTGVRVSLAAMQGIALARGLPLAGVSTLEALAWNAPFCARRIVPLLDARKGELYAAEFECGPDGKPCRIRDDAVVPPEPFFTELAEACRPVLLVGDGGHAYAALVERILGGAAASLDGSAALPRAGNVARLAAAALRAGPRESLDPSRIAPRYLRPVEREWKRPGGG